MELIVVFKEGVFWHGKEHTEVYEDVKDFEYADEKLYFKYKRVWNCRLNITEIKSFKVIKKDKK